MKFYESHFKNNIKKNNILVIYKIGSKNIQNFKINVDNICSIKTNINTITSMHELKEC